MQEIGIERRKAGLGRDVIVLVSDEEHRENSHGKSREEIENKGFCGHGNSWCWFLFVLSTPNTETETETETTHYNYKPRLLFQKAKIRYFFVLREREWETQ